MRNRNENGLLEASFLAAHFNERSIGPAGRGSEGQKP